MQQKHEFEKRFRDQILRCSSCGFCQAVCPVYGATIRPGYNARGKMLILKEIMDGSIALDDQLVETLFQCTTCGSCAQGCPSGVNVPDIIKQVRKDMVGVGSCHPAFSGMKEVLERYGNIYAENVPVDFGRIRNRQAENVFFAGCVGSYREDDATRTVLDIFDRLKVDYTLIDEVCCSGMLEDVGFETDAQLAGRNIERILSSGAKRVITGCPYCSRTFGNSAAYGALRENGVSVLHVSQFLKDLDFGVKTRLRVTYHDPCDLGRHCGIYEEPRAIIRKIAPNFIEMQRHHAEALCCGAGGGVRGAFPKNSLAMARRRLAEAEAANADVVLTECNSCLHNLSNAKLRKQRFEIRTTLQFIRELLESKR